MRSRCAAKRGAKRHSVSLQEHMIDGEVCHRCRGSSVSEMDRVILRLDVRAVAASLPPHLRRPCRRLMEMSISDAARTLGASKIYTFFHVIMPIALNGLISGAIMAFARSLGEFGATIMFAGNFQGRTQTMPLAIYTAMQGDLSVSLCLALILVIISFVVIALVKMLTRKVYKNVRD